MTGFVLRRLASLIPTWIGISLLAFVLAVGAPGDPAQIILNAQLDEPPTEQQLAAFRERTGLNDPLPVQYLAFLGDVVRGDLGTSFRSGDSVREELASRVGPTVQIALPAFALSTLLAVVLGTWSALRRNRLTDHVSRTFALVLESIPTFALAYFLIIVFSVELGVLPVAGRGSPRHLVLPVATLTLATCSTMMRLMRSSMLDVLQDDHIRTAHAIGLRRRTLVWRWALKNAIGPVITLAGLVLAGFVTGTVIVETVFSWPGLGRYVVDAVFDRDYAVIQGFVVFAGTIFVLVNLLVDIVAAAIDPRIRAPHRERP